MGNTFSFRSSSSLSQAYPLSDNFVPRNYQVFISHRGQDTKQNTASHLYHNLYQKGYTVFLDQYSIREGEPITKSVEHVIRSALVHVVIFSPHFADSEWCLNELYMKLETQAPIIPVFWEIEPSEVSMEDGDGAYARAFQMRKQAGKFKTGTLKKWKEALRNVSDIKGFIYDGDLGKKLEEIVGCVVDFISENANLTYSVAED